MKQFLLFAVLSMLGLSSCSNESSKNETTLTDSTLLSTDLVNNPRTANGIAPEDLEAMPTMEFSDTVYNFGTIKEGDIVVHEFEFKNNGKNPLIISNAKGTCGCTAPEYSTEPIPGGKTGVMKIQFNSAGKSGFQNKSVSITTNSKRGIHVLYIKGEVK